MPLASDEFRMVRTLLDHLVAGRGAAVVAGHLDISEEHLRDLHDGHVPLTSDMLGRLLELYAQPEPREGKADTPRPSRKAP